jgi:hypothetical protein
MKKHRIGRKTTRALLWTRDQPTVPRSVADIGKGQTLDDLTVQDFDRVTAERRKAAA